MELPNIAWRVAGEMMLKLKNIFQPIMSQINRLSCNVKAGMCGPRASSSGMAAVRRRARRRAQDAMCKIINVHGGYLQSVCHRSGRHGQEASSVVMARAAISSPGDTA